LNINCLLAATFLLLSSGFGHAAGVIKCTDKSGNVLFTENAYHCSGQREPHALTLAVPSGLNKDRVNYSSPNRHYVSADGKWNIHVEKSLLEGDQDLFRASVAKLRETLDYVFSLMPLRSRTILSDLQFYIMWGEASPNGGRKSGMSYIRKGEPGNYPRLDKKWENSIVIYSAENLMYLDDLWSRKAVFHELAHAWHIANWAEKHPPIYNSWKSAKDGNRYTNVRDIKNRTIKNAYALKNQLEYFAELSAIYFVGGNYHPYDRAALEKYDPSGHRMVEALWD